MNQSDISSAVPEVTVSNRPENFTTSTEVKPKLKSLDAIIEKSTLSNAYIIVCVITALIACWIIFLNGIVIHTLLFKKVYKDVTDFFVSSLSIADLITGVVLLYVTSYSIFLYQNYYECLFRFGVIYTVSHCSYTHIFAITIDRYVKVKYPLKYFTIFTKNTAIFISASIWICCVIIGMLPLLGWNMEYKPENNSDTVCKFFGVLPNGYFVFSFSITLATLSGTILLYLGIVIKAIQKQRNMKSLTNGVHSNHSLFNDHTWKLVKTVAIIVVFSNICWSPSVISIGLHVFGQLEGLTIEERGRLITYTAMSVFLNSLINPLIYAVKIKEVKNRFKHVFCCRQRSII